MVSLLSVNNPRLRLYPIGCDATHPARYTWPRPVGFFRHTASAPLATAPRKSGDVLDELIERYGKGAVVTVRPYMFLSFSQERRSPGL
jgi:hypothetical protein